MGIKKSFIEQIPESKRKAVEMAWQMGANQNSKINNDEKGLVELGRVEIAEEGWEQEVLSKVAASEVVESLLEGLRPNQALVIRERFLNDDGGKTLQQVADILGVSAVRVREIQQTALSKMFIRARSKGINDILK